MNSITKPLIYLLLLSASFPLFAAPPKDAAKVELEIKNKTSFPLQVFQGQWRRVVLPGDRLQTQDYKNATITISTSTPDAAIRFVTLSNAKGCKAQTCMLITGN
ncbi:MULTISPECIES: hypothetical protein [Gammaproteobacteria]|uniref:Uncharacterized protein n=1 Tax=Pseudomonas syringae TaxID=317 RepID=A0A0L1MQ47_PSESX|nr:MULTISPECIES: hypothetical protein [Gammaproteobacteria]KNH30359.1 hypothetical protein ACS77_00650 [Pseudomonas syringae]MBK5303084.1 hypothetical protein [Bacillus sp. TH86]MBK5322853.1 hypothetical protein [Bacillus sp. TH59]MBK5337803.1 hypothetical protein [Bacillus sp. TH57]MBK5311857.1 hypothetical protein [Pseudomonas sp. TH71]